MNFLNQKYLLVTLMFLVNTGFRHSLNFNETTEKWVVQKAGKLTVEGRSNIHAFICTIDGYTNKDTLEIFQDKPEHTRFRISGDLKYNLSEFTSSSALMTREIKKTLEVEKFPLMVIETISFDQFSEMKRGEKTIKGFINIQLHGVKRKFDVSCQLSEDNNQLVHVKCQRFVNFSDFGIAPPKGLAGLFKTEDQLLVNVSFAIQRINKG